MQRNVEHGEQHTSTNEHSKNTAQNTMNCSDDQWTIGRNNTEDNEDTQQPMNTQAIGELNRVIDRWEQSNGRRMVSPRQAG